MLHKYGITKDYVIGSLKYSAVVTLIGFVLITLLGFSIGFKNSSLSVSWLAFYLIISVPLQEFVFRGFIQTHLLRIEKIGAAGAIVVASAIYSSVHYTNILLIIITFLSGLAWGYVFYKKPNLLGPIISHAILGSYLFLLVL